MEIKNLLKKSPKDLSLKHKIILHVAVIGILAAILLTFLYIRTQKNIIQTMSRQKVELVVTTIKNSIFSSMREGKVEEVDIILQQIASQSDIKKIRIISTKGRILRSSEKDENGSPAGGQTFNNIKATISKKSQSNIFFIEPKSTILGYGIIENKKDCLGCHSSKEKINGILEVNIDYSPASTLLQKSQITGIIIGVVFLTILTFIIFRLFEKLINRPITQLKNKMKKVQEGSLDIELTPLKNDEIGSLTKSFNLMVRNLKEANNKIETLFKRQMEKAEHLASIGELAAGLAHEIKNPLAGMKGALEIINQKTEASDPKKEIFVEILFQIEKINDIIQDLLSYARPKEINISLIDPNECVENAIKLAKNQTNNKDIYFHFKGLEDGTLARIDSDKIQEVMLNMMLNSIYAIQKKGNVTIELHKKQNKELEILFSDDGIGIKKEDLQKIFNPFYTTKFRGTGLGLSICKKIIEAHQGIVEVKSTEGRGTTFVIRLPVLQPSS